MELHPAWMLQQALDKRQWQGGQEMTEREQALVTQLLYLHAQNESLQSALDATRGQYQ